MNIHAVRIVIVIDPFSHSKLGPGTIHFASVFFHLPIATCRHIRFVQSPSAGSCFGRFSSTGADTLRFTFGSALFSSIFLQGNFIFLSFY
jgi:hypothetical protein